MYECFPFDFLSGKQTVSPGRETKVTEQEEAKVFRPKETLLKNF